MIEPPIDPKIGSDAARPGYQLGLRASAKNAADQHALGSSGAGRAEIEQPMHPVNQVNIRSAALGVERLDARGPSSSEGVRGAVPRSLVRLRFGDHRGELPAAMAPHDELAQEVAGHAQCRQVEAGASQPCSRGDVRHRASVKHREHGLDQRFVLVFCDTPYRAHINADPP